VLGTQYLHLESNQAYLVVTVVLEHKSEQNPHGILHRRLFYDCKLGKQTQEQGTDNLA